ncbi:MAG: methyltransferase domain-containing protein [Nostoc sp. ChiSLP02]|nr:methyltransferase domain-containing protein [Nostoc sp. DedSLP05]MDZ8100808.1 methyltransferase domain-containing protein [Nostoc sp. DedSLP01]MDZ8188203.1 methyltransferase domain-containing protein [Nostoc sp. ChiSLP02]
MSNILPRLEFLTQSLFRKQEFCPHCKTQHYQTIARKYILVEVKQCCSCKLCFTSPIYQPLLTSSLYDYFYSAEGSITRLPSNDELIALKNNCFQGSDKYFGDRLKAIKLLSPEGNLLELGSSWGYFLYQAQQYGFKVTGLEISEPRRLFGIQNLGVEIVENINKLDCRLFDIVYTAHTLEHFTDLSTIFKDIYLLLNSKGLLLIEVPNFDYTKFGKQSLSIIGAVHPLGFSSEFFENNLPKYGFKIRGFYNSWDAFPEKAVAKSQQDVVIVMAEKI